MSVHPRACGEQLEWFYTKSESYGSSPRLRGTESQRHCRCAAFRFIPAPAGNSSGESATSWAMAVHPRACGEQKVPALSTGSVIGSSPRLRGTVHLARFNAAYLRFIPAPAGNSASCFLGGLLLAVHPRACGEQLGDVTEHDFTVGSSPRLRGTVARDLCVPALPRFIPAPAGNRENGPYLDSE